MILQIFDYVFLIQINVFFFADPEFQVRGRTPWNWSKDLFDLAFLCLFCFFMPLNFFSQF